MKYLRALLNTRLNNRHKHLKVFNELVGLILEVKKRVFHVRGSKMTNPRWICFHQSKKLRNSSVSQTGYWDSVSFRFVVVAISISLSSSSFAFFTFGSNPRITIRRPLATSAISEKVNCNFFVLDNCFGHYEI